MNSQNIIEIKGLIKKFENFTAVDNINFDVRKGEIFGMLGANGAGKTTTIKMLCGLLKPTSGKASIAGFDIYKQTEKIKKSIGYMSQKFSLYEDLTVYENIRFYAGIYGMKKKDIETKAEQLFFDLNLEKQKNSLIKSLPLGWKQKLAFSIAVFHNPQLVFLDEPTSGVDPITRRMFWELIFSAANKGITVLLSTHYLDEAENCNRVFIMDKGKIVALDEPSNLKKQYNSSNINDVFLKIASNQN